MPRAIPFITKASWLVYAAQYALSVNAFFVMPCGVLTVERADPIVSRGISPGNHVHVIAGGLGFSDKMTTSSAQAGACTTCPVPADKSNYWPMIYFNHKTKGFVASKYNNFVVYYKYEKGQGFEEFPPDFRMVAGDSALREKDDSSVEQWEMSWKCVGADTTTDHSGFPTTPCPHGMRAQVAFPSCGNGETDSPDHRSHIKYPESLKPGVSGRQGDYPGPYSCPDGFKHKYPRIFMEIYFSNTDFDWSEAVNPKQPMVLAMGDPTGYGLHGDFFMGWEKGVLQAALDTCDGTSDTGNTADGRVIFCPAFEDVKRAGNDVAPSTCAKPDPAKGLTYTENVGLTEPIKTLPGCNEITNSNAEQKAAAGKCPSTNNNSQPSTGQGNVSSQESNAYGSSAGGQQQQETIYSQGNTRYSAQGGGYVAGPTSTQTGYGAAASAMYNENNSSKEKYRPKSILGEEYVGGITRKKPETLTVTVTATGHPQGYNHSRFAREHVATQRPGSIRRRIGD